MGFSVVQNHLKEKGMKWTSTLSLWMRRWSCAGLWSWLSTLSLILIQDLEFKKVWSLFQKTTYIVVLFWICLLKVILIWLIAQLHCKRRLMKAKKITKQWRLLKLISIHTFPPHNKSPSLSVISMLLIHWISNSLQQTDCKEKLYELLKDSGIHKSQPSDSEEYLSHRQNH
jgi:hypothetical protein